MTSTGFRSNALLMVRTSAHQPLLALPVLPIAPGPLPFARAENSRAASPEETKLLPGVRRCPSYIFLSIMGFSIV